MDEIVKLTNKLESAQYELEELEGHKANCAFFTGHTVLTADYVLRRDGGDASRKGHLQLYLHDREIKAVLDGRIAEAQAKVDKLASALDAAKSQYVKIKDTV